MQKQTRAQRFLNLYFFSPAGVPSRRLWLGGGLAHHGPNDPATADDHKGTLEVVDT
jgi:hypothetical protein